MSKKSLILPSLAFVMFLVITGLFFRSNKENKNNQKENKRDEKIMIDLEKQENEDSSENAKKEEVSQNINKSVEQGSSTKEDFFSPLPDSKARANKKKFGIYIDSKASPVQPERFRGFHTGVDFEIFPEELKEKIPVKAVCTGEILEKRKAGGYGGLIVGTCKIDGKEIKVVYGHINIESTSLSVGDRISAGDRLADLGEDKSEDTDGERKHLHLGFFGGRGTDIRGYVSSEKELKNWLDPCDYVCE